MQNPRAQQLRLARLLTAMLVGILLAACGTDESPEAGEAPADSDADAESDVEPEPDSEAEAEESAPDEVETLEVAVSHTGLPGLVTTVMEELGIAEEHGLEISTVDMGPAEAQVALAQGRVPVGMMPVMGAIQMNLEDVPLRVIAPMNANHLSLVTSDDSPYESIGDLSGEPVGVIGRTGLAYTDFSLLAAEEGLNIEEDMELFVGDGGAVLSWILEGDVEAGPLWEGVLTAQLVEGDVPLRELVVYREALEELFGFVPLGQGWAASEEWIEGNPDIARRFQRAAIEAADALAEDPSLIVEYGDTFGPETEEGLEAAAERASDVFISEWSADYIEDQEVFIERYIELGLLPEEAPGPSDIYLLLDDE